MTEPPPGGSAMTETMAPPLTLPGEPLSPPCAPGVVITKLAELPEKTLLDEAALADALPSVSPARSDSTPGPPGTGQSACRPGRRGGTASSSPSSDSRGIGEPT